MVHSFACGYLHVEKTSKESMETGLVPACLKKIKKKGHYNIDILRHVIIFTKITVCNIVVKLVWKLWDSLF